MEHLVAYCDISVGIYWHLVTSGGISGGSWKRLVVSGISGHVVVSPRIGRHQVIADGHTGEFPN